MSQTRSVEAIGQDIEQAIEAGLKLLDVSRESVIVEVLEEPSRGLLGIGARQARVRLTTALPPMSERILQSPPPAESTPRREGPSQPAHRQPRPPTIEEQSESDDEEVNYSEIRASGAVDENTLSEEVRSGMNTLREMLHYMDVEATLSIERALESENEDEPPPYILHIRGKELGFLIGRRGETLAALQYLTRLIAGRDLEQRAEFVVDVENYKARREVLLRKLAQRMAKEAMKRRRPVELEPMPPHERRIIHMALRNHSQVYTESVGEGNRRKVTIIPK